MRTMFRPLRWIAVLLGASLPAASFAEIPTLNNLTAGDYDSIVKEFSANFMHSTVTPASSLGGLGGFEFGLVGGVTKDPELVSLVKRSSPSTNLPSYLVHASILGRVGLPWGLTAEALVFPKRTISSVSLQQYGGSLQWTLTDPDSLIQDWPVDIAVKFSLNQAKLQFTQNATVTSTTTVVPVTVEFKDTEWNLMGLASKKVFSFFELFGGIGYVKSKGTLSIGTGGFNVNYFSAAFPVAATSNSAESKPSSVQFLGGLDIRLAFFSIGAEYISAFNTDTMSGRLSFRF